MDVKTMIVMMALGNLTLAIMLFLFDFGIKKAFSSSSWTHAKIVQAVAWSMLALRADLPYFMTVLLGNCLLFVGLALEVAAMMEASEQRHWRRYLLLPLALALIAFNYAYFTDQLPSVRITISAIGIGVFYFLGALSTLLQWRSASRLARSIAIAASVFALTMVLRAAWAMFSPHGFTMLDQNWVQDLSFTCIYILMLINGFGCLLIAREKQDRELQRLAVVDPLTDAPNRRGFYSALAPWVALARRHGQSTALIMLDLDHFKRVNDAYGHQVGDIVLKAVVEVGQKQLRDSDMLGRLGGEEFAVLLPRTTIHDAMMVAERMRQAISLMPIKTERALIYVTASMGVTTIRPDDSMVSLFKRADEALYAAKEAGRNKVHEAPAVGKILA